MFLSVVRDCVPEEAGSKHPPPQKNSRTLCGLNLPFKYHLFDVCDAINDRGAGRRALGHNKSSKARIYFFSASALLPE